LSKSELRTEKYDLPGSVDGICSLIREVLNGGHVQRVELDNDDTLVRVKRWVDEAGGLEEEEISWDGALRNVPDMMEYYSDEATSFQVVVDMMLLAQENGMHAVSWVTGTGDEGLLRKWFDVDGRALPVGDISVLLGLPIHRLKSLPEETLVLCCSKYPGADPSELMLAVKTTIDLRRSDDAHNKKDDRGRNHSEEHPSTAPSLGLGTRGLRTVPWNPPDQSGHE